MTLVIERIFVELKSLSFDNKVCIRLKKLCLRETEKIHEDILRNDGDGNLCEIDVDNFGIFSPNIQDTEMMVKIRIGRLHMLFDPFTLNNVLKFFRYNKYVQRTDIEGLYNQLREKEESELDATKVMSQVSKQTCEKVKIILMKVDVIA